MLNQDRANAAIDRTGSDASATFARWMALIAGGIFPSVFVLAYTVDGLLRPGYSTVQRAISDLGTGPNGWILDTLGVIRGLLMIGFAAAFWICMRGVLSGGWRWTAAGLLALWGGATVIVSLFTDAPSTVRIHSLATIVGLLCLLLAFLVVGVALSRQPAWRRCGAYSLIAFGLTILLVVFEFMAFRPGTLLGQAHVAGLAERAVSVETFAWFVAFGWRLFRGAPATA
jgi:hypothetical membrane protein